MGRPIPAPSRAAGTTSGRWIGQGSLVGLERLRDPCPTWAAADGRLLRPGRRVPRRCRRSEAEGRLRARRCWLEGQSRQRIPSGGGETRQLWVRAGESGSASQLSEPQRRTDARTSGRDHDCRRPRSGRRRSFVGGLEPGSLERRPELQDSDRWPDDAGGGADRASEGPQRPRLCMDIRARRRGRAHRGGYGGGQLRARRQRPVGAGLRE